MLWFRTIIVLLLTGSVSLAEDWPQWLGPNRDGSTREKVAPWKEAPKVLWQRPVGEGFSSPVVAEGRVFLHAKVKDKDEEEVLALDAETGKQLWRASYPRAAFTSAIGNGPRATPAVERGHVYTFGITGVLSCFEAKTGKQRWQVDTSKKFEVKPPRFGACCSPLVDGNRLLLSVGGQGASIVAFDTDQGEVAWQNLSAPASTASPIFWICRLNEKEVLRQVVFVTGQNLLALDPGSGALYWDYPLTFLPVGSSPTPVCTEDLLLTSSMATGGMGLRLADKNGKLQAAPAWKNASLAGYFSTPVVVGKDHVYQVTTTLLPQPSSSLRCLEIKSGKELWVKPDIADYHAGLLRTGDDKVLLLNDAGDLKLLEANPKAYRELARAKVSGPTFVNPALAKGRLYVRDDKALLCLELAK
jgi:outer membrane protein assembly factor BamB